MPEDVAPDLPRRLTPHLFPLHAALDVPALWEAVRDLLRAAVPCHRVTLFLGHLGMGEARLVFTDPPMENAEDWFARRGKGNPFSPWIEDNIGAPMYLFSDIVGPPSAFRETEFYRLFAEPEGWDKGLSVLFWNKRDVRAMYSLYRGPDERAISAGERRLLDALRPHIETALVRVQRLDRETNFRRVLEAFTKSVPVPLVLLDWDGRTEFVNPEGIGQAALWNYGGQARALGGKRSFRLPGPVRVALNGLRDEVSAIEPKALARSLPTPREVVLDRDPRFRARVSVALTGSSALARPGFFVLFREPPEQSLDGDEAALSEQTVRDLQQLTPAERELARYVCRGLSNREIAEELSKSVLTVKTQLNNIFQKLDLRSRAQLIARLRL